MTTVKLTDLPLNVAEDIRDFQHDNPGATKGEELELWEAVRQYLKWNGIMGYDKDIKTIVEARREEAPAGEIRILQMKMVLSDGMMAYASRSDSGDLLIDVGSMTDLQYREPTDDQRREATAVFTQAEGNRKEELSKETVNLATAIVLLELARDDIKATLVAVEEFNQATADDPDIGEFDVTNSTKVRDQIESFLTGGKS